MTLFFHIFSNSLLFFLTSRLLNTYTGFSFLTCGNTTFTSICDFETAFLFGIFFWFINYILKYLLNMVGMGDNLLNIFLFHTIINTFFLIFIDKMWSLLQIPSLSFETPGTRNLIIVVAIFSIFNILYASLFIKS